MEIQWQQGYELEDNSPIMYFAFPLMFSQIYLLYVTSQSSSFIN